MGSLDGKSALVTGASSTTHDCIAAYLLDLGAAVMAQTAGPEAGGAAAGDGAPSQVARCWQIVDEAAAQLGGLDILVASVGLAGRMPFFDVSEGQFDEMLDATVRSQYFHAQRAAWHMAKGGGGNIVLMGAVYAHAGGPGYALDSIAAGAVIGLAHQLAAELAPQRIRVNVIAPAASAPGDRGQAAPLGRLAAPEDIARAVAFLASDNAGLITGQVLYVDGGITSGLAASPVPWGR